MESGNDYVIQVKGNYPRIYNYAKTHIANTDYSDKDYTKEKNKGRIEQRECRTYSVDQPPAEYESCRMIVHIKNSGVRNGKKYQEDHYYLSNKLKDDASYYNKGIRGHWSIENSCHWVKDVILYEDKSLVKGMELGENLSVLRNLIINIYRLNKHWSIKKAIEKYTNKLSDSLQLMQVIHI